MYLRSGSVSICFLLLLLQPLFSHAQAQTNDRIIGVWINEEKDGQIEIYKQGNKYFGKIVDGKELYDLDGKTLRKDIKNPDPKLKTRALLNAVILSDFVFTDGAWIDGKIYDPKSGRTYSSTMKLKGAKLELRGYVGVSLFGRTTVWERAKQ